MRQKISPLHLIVITLFSYAFAATASSTPINTAPLGEIIEQQELSAPAEVLSVNTAQLRSEISSVVTKIHHEVGDIVKKGEPLMQMDCALLAAERQQLKSELTAQQAELTLAQQRRKRAKQLRARKNISEEDWNIRNTDARVKAARVDTQKALLSQAQLRESKCTVKAPFKGLITHRDAQLGSTANISDPLFQLTDIENIYVRASLLKGQTPLINENTIIFYKNATQSTQLLLSTILPIIDRNNHNRIALLSSQDALLVGSKGRIYWKSPLFTLASRYLVQRNGQRGFFINQNNKATFIRVADSQEGRPAVLKRSFNPKWELITDGQNTLNHGDTLSQK